MRRIARALNTEAVARRQVHSADKFAIEQRFRIVLEQPFRRAFQVGVRLFVAVSLVSAMAVCVGCSGAAGTKTALADSSDSVDGTAAIRASLGDYSWDELSAISKKIGAAADEDEAYAIAKTYHLMSDDGKLDPWDTKKIVFDDGTDAYVQIAGFYQDEKADGSGKAGITFIFTDAVLEEPMNNKDDNAGGWADSSMRRWLNNQFCKSLPDDLQRAIEPASKWTNNVGATNSVDSVTATSDSVWLFSASEICGEISWWDEESAYYNSGPFNEISNKEGSRYLLFNGLNYRNDKESLALQKDSKGKSISWWLRSPSPYYSSSFRYVDQDGMPFLISYASRLRCVVPGFCL
jgi:hypothetical protein